MPFVEGSSNDITFNRTLTHSLIWKSEQLVERYKVSLKCLVIMLDTRWQHELSKGYVLVYIITTVTAV